MAKLHSRAATAVDWGTDNYLIFSARLIVPRSA